LVVRALPTVADCERVQTDWYLTRARVLGGRVWHDGPLTWILGPGVLSLMFPRELPGPALRRGIEVARDLGVSVGVWLRLDVDIAALPPAGFERGWAPWWMAAPIDAVGPADDERIELQRDSADYQGEQAEYRRELALTRTEPQRSWYAAAYAPPERRFAGRAWAHLHEDAAGVFDMEVWPPFQRRGLGTGLLRAVCAAARDAGATHAVLNATPDGKQLYQARGFDQIGAGVTWWLHPDPSG
jgi:GNAT superfamily N-acetyltransferase